MHGYVLIGPHGSLLVLCAFIGRFLCLCISMDFNGSLFVPIVPYAPFKVLKDP